MESLKCKVCFKIFARKENLKRHTLIHTGEKPFSCELCGKSYNRKYSLAIHIRSHFGERTHFCKVCGKGFICSSHLSKHTRKLHPEEKCFECPKCSETFAQRCILKQHVTKCCKNKDDKSMNSSAELEAARTQHSYDSDRNQSADCAKQL